MWPLLLLLYWFFLLNVEDPKDLSRTIYSSTCTHVQGDLIQSCGSEFHPYNYNFQFCISSFSFFVWSQPWLVSFSRSLYPIHQPTVTVLPSRSVHTLTTPHHLHYYRPGQATIICPTDYCKSLLTIPPVIYSPRSGQYGYAYDLCQCFAQNPPKA